MVPPTRAGRESRVDDQGSFDPHRALGEVIGILAVVAFLAALAYWRDRRLIGITFALAVMAEVLQHLFGLPNHPWVAGGTRARHALDGITILALSAWLAHQAWRGNRHPATASSPATTAVV